MIESSSPTRQEGVTDPLLDALQQCASLNRRHWPSLPRAGGAVLVDGTVDAPSYLMGAGLLARALAEADDLQLHVLLDPWKGETSEAQTLFESFACRQFINFGHGLTLVRAGLAALPGLVGYALRRFDPETFIGLECGGVRIGDLVHDSFVRKGRRFRAGIKWDWPFLKEVIKGFIYVHWYRQLFRCRKIEAVILSHRFYAFFGALARVALQHGARVYVLRRCFARCYASPESIYVNEFKPSEDIIASILEQRLEQRVDDYLAKRFAGEIRQHDVANAFKGKRDYSREELDRLLDLEPSWPIVFIMPHAFSDANHANDGMLFRDYYDWFLETVRFVNAVPGVNWVVKPHPSSYLYNEDGEVEQLLSDEGLDNIKLVPRDFNTRSTFPLAKTVLTVSGTVGVEAACLGIRPIIAGRATYSGLEIALEPATREAYFAALANVGQLEQLDDDSVRRAKAMLYWYHIGAYMPSEVVPSMTFAPFGNTQEARDLKLAMYAEIISNLRDSSPRQDTFFQAALTMVREREEFLCGI